MTTTHERELTEPVDLCGPDGRLNPAAVGWTRTPLHRANVRGWGRGKRWEYWGIVTPRYVVGLVLSSLDYASVHSMYLLDRRTGREIVREATVPLARGAVLPERCGVGTASVRTRALSLTFTTSADHVRLQAEGEGVVVDLLVSRPPHHESLGVVVPWNSKRFQYTAKDVALPVTGSIDVFGEEFHVEPGTSFAVLDHGRGKWPYAMTWNWAAGSGPDGRGLSLGGGWTDGTGMTENAVLVDGRLHKIGEELTWDYDRTDWLRPWRIHGPRVDVVFTPFHERMTRTNLGVVANETHQCFGEFTGWARIDDATFVALDGLVGWAEEARNRW